MPVETPSLFAQVIQDHLELKQRNSELEGNLPLELEPVAGLRLGGLRRRLRCRCQGARALPGRPSEMTGRAYGGDHRSAS